MKILEMKIENCYTLLLRFNWILIIVSIVIIIFLYFHIKKSSIFGRNSIYVDEVTLGIGDNKIKLKYDRKDQEIAYKLWVELNTRKIGLKYDTDFDVIEEVYNSWYKFFEVTRELLKEIPSERLKYSEKLIDLTRRVLNDGLRPHLTKWQAKYRKWYSQEKEDDKNKNRTPQEIQKEYPEYDDLIKDLIVANNKIIEYEKLMKDIAFPKR